MKTLKIAPKQPVQLPGSAPKPRPKRKPAEGDLRAARRYRASVESFVQSGKVEDAARDAEPRTPVDEMEMFNAERIGESRSKGEDPAPDR